MTAVLLTASEKLLLAEMVSNPLEPTLVVSATKKETTCVVVNLTSLSRKNALRNSALALTAKVVLTAMLEMESLTLARMVIKPN
jgi:hypothetical protein